MRLLVNYHFKTRFLLRTPPNRYVCRNSIKYHIIAVLEYSYNYGTEQSQKVTAVFHI